MATPSGAKRTVRFGPRLLGRSDQTDACADLFQVARKWAQPHRRLVIEAANAKLMLDRDEALDGHVALNALPNKLGAPIAH